MNGFGSIDEALELLVPLFEGVEAEGDWAAVVLAASNSAERESRSARRLRAPRRPLLLIALLALAALIPVSALAIAKGDPWWFLHDRDPLGLGPAASSDIVLIDKGTWNGHAWALTAFRSPQGLCYRLTTKPLTAGNPPQGGAACGGALGTIVRTANGSRRVTISYLAGGIPADVNGPGVRYVAGPVVASATEVVVTLRDGTVSRAPTLDAPASLGVATRFYAVPLPAPRSEPGAPATCGQRVAQLTGNRPASVVGRDAAGRVVARLPAVRPPPGLARTLCAPHRNHFDVPPSVPAAGRKLTTVAQVMGPYGAVARLSAGAPVPITSYRSLPIGARTRIVEPTRCWKVSFSNGQSQGSCMPLVERREPELGPQVQHAGRDTFVIAETPPRTGPAIARVTLTLANGRVLSAAPVDGIVLFAIPARALSATRSQRGFLRGYDAAGRQVWFYNAYGRERFQRQPVYYRSCARGSGCG